MKNRRGQPATKWFLYFFRKSISQRKGRVVIASVSVMLAVAIVTGMLGITSGIKEKLGSELKAYGANIIVSPLKGDSLDYDVMGTISKMDHVEDVTGQVFGRVFIRNHAIEIIGLDVKRLRDRGWRLFGNWPVKEDEILAGINLKDVLKLEKGITLSLENKDMKKDVVVSGFIEKGGPEDSAFIMSIEEAWDVTGIAKKLNAILVSGTSGELENVVENIRDVVSSAMVKTSRQVAFAEESLLAKIQLLMALVTVVVLFATAISVASTMGANVLERREEIGLMKAIGATRRDISSFYIAEAVLIGIIGGVSGFLLGFVFAQAVSKGAFDSFITVALYLPFLSLLIGLSVSVFAGYFPVRDAMKYNPAVILRGE
jgi:putative ABC transport system permease protein